MKVSICKRDFSFFEISEDSQENFLGKTSRDLSDFDAWGLKLAGDAIRPKSSQHFWCNGAYCWYTDETQEHEQCVWLTRNNILMFQDFKTRKLYRVEDISNRY